MVLSFSSISLVVLLLAIPNPASGYEYVHIDTSGEFSRSARISITVLFGLVFASLTFLSWRNRPVHERRLVAFLGSWLMILMRKLFEHGGAPPFLVERGVLVEPVFFLLVSMWITALMDVGRNQSVDSKSFGSTFLRSTLWIPTARTTSEGAEDDEHAPWIFLAKTMGSSLFLTGSVSAVAVSVKAYDDIHFTDFALDMALPVFISTMIVAAASFASQYYVARASCNLGCCGIRLQITDSRGPYSSCKRSQSPRKGGDAQEMDKHHHHDEEEGEDKSAVNVDKAPSPKDGQHSKPDYNWESHRTIALRAELETDNEAPIQSVVQAEGEGDVTTEASTLSTTTATNYFCWWWEIPRDETVCLVLLGLLYAWNRNVMLALISTAVVLALSKTLLHLHASSLQMPMPSMAASPEVIYSTISTLDYGSLLWYVSLMAVTSGWSDTGVPQTMASILLGGCAEQISTGSCQLWTTALFGTYSALLSPLPAVLIFGDTFPYANPYQWIQLAFAVSIGGSLCLLAGEVRPCWARGQRARRRLWKVGFAVALIVGSTVMQMFHWSAECSERLGECSSF